MRMKDNLAGWRMVMIGFLAQNCAMCLLGGSYATALGAIQQELNISRALASSAVAITFLAIGLCSPFVGALINRFALRDITTAGAALGAVGFAMASYTTDYRVFLGAFAFLVGPGCCLLGVLPTTTLVTRWFEKDRGKALAIANAPFFILIAPPIAALLVEKGGRSLLLLVLALVFASIVPALRRIADWPPDADGGRDGRIKEAGALSAQSILSTGQILKDGRIWMLSVAAGILTGAGTSFATHIVSIGTGRGIDLSLAATLLSAFGGGTLIGAAIFGWLIDRIGAFYSMMINAGCQAALWLSLYYLTDFGPIMAASAMLGMCSGTVVALHSSGIYALVGNASFSKAMGISYFLKVPFLFSIAPLSGHLFDIFGDYGAATLTSSALLAISAILIIFAALGQSQRARV